MPNKAAICISISLLAVIMGRFGLTDVLMIRPVLQFFIGGAIFVIGLFYLLRFPSAIFHPVQLLIVLMIISEILFRSNPALIVMYSFYFMVLIILSSLSINSIIAITKYLIIIFTIFAIAAILQFMILLAFPELIKYTCYMFTNETGSSQYIMPEFHLIAFLGFTTCEPLTILELPVTRMRTFLTEPSLNVLYYLIPASLSLLLNKPWSRACAIILITYSIMSLSGMVFFTIGFACIFFILTYILNRTIFALMPILICTSVVYFLFDSESLITIYSWLDFFSNVDSLNKVDSFNQRMASYVEFAALVPSSPLGSSILPTLPGSLIINVIMFAGWAGGLIVVSICGFIFYNFSSYLYLNQSTLNRVSISMLFGAMTNIIGFNDYEVLSYTGLVYLMIIYRFSVDFHVGRERRCLRLC